MLTIVQPLISPTNVSTVNGANGPVEPSTLARGAIALDNVSLVRRTQEELHYDVKSRILRMFSAQRSTVRKRKVLNDVTLRVAAGEKVGIIGPNGGGKSTLLKVLAGVLRPTTGTVAVAGTVSPLIELGVGFESDLTLVDNILYYGVLLGHDREMVRTHVDEILDFAELTEYRDEPTKTLSSGMHARLSFAIATEFRADIILVDEVLSVGDERFRRKCEARINRFWDQHSTILLVSHDMLTIAQICDRVVWIDHGSIRYVGPAGEAQRLYLSTIPSVSTLRRGEDLVELAKSNGRGEVLVGGTSGSPLLYIVRDGRRHAIASPNWCAQHNYSSEDIVRVEDRVILEIADGNVIT
jgi:ABC-2 type transport system ATP-binding protein